METPIASIKEGTGDNEISSSEHKVVSSEDLLIEILVRLPIISLHLLRFVSKWWLSLITSPKFVTRRSKITKLDPTSGLFLRGESSAEFEFLPFDIRIPAISFPLHPSLAGSSLTIEDSCNGLLLCYNDWRNVYVYNPSINMLKKLPEYHCDYPKLAFDPTKSPYYKVVGVESLCPNTHYGIQIYSSKTGTWSRCMEEFYYEDVLGFSDGIYWNDAIHWLDLPLDGREILHRKFNVEHQDFEIISCKDVTLDDHTVADCDFKLFKSRGCLLSVILFNNPVLELNVYEMNNEDSGWSAKYFVTHDEKWRSLPFGDGHFHVLSIMLGEREEDSFFVMFLDGKVVRYNFVSRNVSTLTNFRLSDPLESFEIIASFACV